MNKGFLLKMLVAFLVLIVIAYLPAPYRSAISSEEEKAKTREFPPTPPGELERVSRVKGRNSFLLLAIPGVVGHGVGRCADGNICIKVYLKRETIASLFIPRALQGVKVEKVLTGAFYAQ